MKKSAKKAKSQKRKSVCGRIRKMSGILPDTFGSVKLDGMLPDKCSMVGDHIQAERSRVESTRAGINAVLKLGCACGGKLKLNIPINYERLFTCLTCGNDWSDDALLGYWRGVVCKQVWADVRKQQDEKDADATMERLLASVQRGVLSRSEALHPWGVNVMDERSIRAVGSLVSHDDLVRRQGIDAIEEQKRMAEDCAQVTQESVARLSPCLPWTKAPTTPKWSRSQEMDNIRNEINQAVGIPADTMKEEVPPYFDPLRPVHKMPPQVRLVDPEPFRVLLRACGYPAEDVFQVVEVDRG